MNFSRKDRLMTKKYFFFDIDGTLGLGISSIIPADTLYCLRRLVQEVLFLEIEGELSVSQ